MILSDSVVISLIGAFATVIPSTVSAVLAFLSHKQQSINSDNILETKGNIAKIESNTNSMTDVLVATTYKAAKAEGVLEGKNANS